MAGTNLGVRRETDAGEFPYSCAETLRRDFVAGLERLLRDESGLGPYILVLNNALIDASVARALGAELAHRFETLASRCLEAAADGAELGEPPDDWSVFKALITMGFAAIEPVREHALGDWRLQFNQVRALRPARSAGAAPLGNRAPFDDGGFHFDKPFLRKEAFWQGSVDGVDLELLYNKFPFASHHGLLVPERGAHRPQWLQMGDHALVWGLASTAGVAGFGIGYNSYGAYASINHLHFQVFADANPLPIEQPRWRHNGGDRSYPTECFLCTEAGAAWHCIDALQRAGTSFNLLYRPGRLYCLPRRRQGQQRLPDWCGGLAWFELCGAFVVTEREAFARLGEAEPAALLAASALSV
jgi:hypothetical protein